MGAKAVATALARQSQFGWRFLVENCLVTQSLDGDFLQGLLVENTPYKDTVYIWDFILPSFHPRPSLALNFSLRLDDGGYFVGSPGDIVKRVVETLGNDDGSKLGIRSPTSLVMFINKHARKVEFHYNHPVSTAFSMAAAHALEGDASIAKQIFLSLQQRTSNDVPDDPVRTLTLACLDCLEQGRSLRPVLDSATTANRARWRIVPVKPAARKPSDGDKPDR
jgi:hypothetical protein